MMVDRVEPVVTLGEGWRREEKGYDEDEVGDWDGGKGSLRFRCVEMELCM